MLLVIDVGNTNIVFGVFDGAQLKAKFRLTTQAPRTADEIGLMLVSLIRHADCDPAAVEHIIVESVVPKVMYTLRHALDKYIGKPVYTIGDNLKIPYVNLCQEPLGSDRVVTGYGALELYGAPIIVVDFGTATKVDVFNQERAYIGGVICPGIQISMDALYACAAKLPQVEIAKPRSPIGINTVEQMQSGAVYGYVGSIEGILKGIQGELRASNVHTEFPVIVTGGLASLIAAHSSILNNRVNQNLTLQGLRLAFENLL
jgi:type III pantothenate kinase